MSGLHDQDSLLCLQGDQSLTSVDLDIKKLESEKILY